MGGVWVFPGGAVDAARGRRRRGPPRGGDPRAARGGGDRARRSRRAGQVLALDHARAGADPLRHALLPRAAARRAGAARSTARRCVDLGWFTPQAALDAHAAQRDRARLSDDQAPRAAERASPRCEELLDSRARARRAAGRAEGGARGRGRARAAAGRPRLLSRARAVRRSLLRGDHVRDRVDQREVRERLRVVAEVAAARGLELLGVELERRGVGRAAARRGVRPRGPRRSPTAPRRARTSRSGTCPPCRCRPSSVSSVR